MSSAKKKFVSYFLAAGLAASVTGFVSGAQAQAEALSEEQVRAIVRDEIAKNPQIIIDTLNAYVQEQQAAEARSATDKVIAKKADIAMTENLPYSGNKEGTVELVYFFDVNCGYCKRLDPSIKRIVAENPDIRVSHREIPILAHSSHLAAFAEGLVWKLHPEKYHEFHDSLMAHQGALTEQDVEAKLAEAVGAEEAERILESMDNIDNDLVAREVNNQVQENLAIARAAGITGTPFVYVLQGDGLMRGAGENAYEQLNELIAQARAAN